MVRDAFCVLITFEKNMCQCLSVGGQGKQGERKDFHCVFGYDESED